ncbi:hypothetical protein [Segetibacter aerophilus]|uniref:Uncharacterized protein n=1 Tax=Segetibacter aerophilus TaxID=670293 RepID=A0A512BA60_9BACT|nr:hypothetical protein [Segetibacter aerophilus]GEO08717.1 hypothetical protein SAE01_12130 [Segetibacter aerophilus]
MPETSISNVELLVDGEEVSLRDFIKTNVIDDVQVSLEELNAVLNLKVGKLVCLGLADVQRVK